MQPTFADGIISISITGPLVRIELGVSSPTLAADGLSREMRLTPAGQLVMPVDGFVRAFGTQEQAIKKLLADGVIKMNTKT